MNSFLVVVFDLFIGGTGIYEAYTLKMLLDIEKLC